MKKFKVFLRFRPQLSNERHKRILLIYQNESSLVFQDSQTPVQPSSKLAVRRRRSSGRARRRRSGRDRRPRRSSDRLGSSTTPPPRIFREVQLRPYRIFATGTSQRTIFHHIEKVSHNFTHRARNSLVLLYGKTGAGKTYTAGLSRRYFGSSRRIQETDGIVKRVVLDIFKNKSPRQHIFLSMVEIYGNRAYDLLHGKRPLQVRGVGDYFFACYSDETNERRILNSRAKVYVEDLSDALRRIRIGIEMRETAEQSENYDSSRSHCLLFMYCCEELRSSSTSSLTSPSSADDLEDAIGAEADLRHSTTTTSTTTTSSSELTTVSTLCIADLAGSERNKKQGRMLHSSSTSTSSSDFGRSTDSRGPVHHHHQGQFSAEEELHCETISINQSLSFLKVTLEEMIHYNTRLRRNKRMEKRRRQRERKIKREERNRNEENENEGEGEGEGEGIETEGGEEERRRRRKKQLRAKRTKLNSRRKKNRGFFSSKFRMHSLTKLLKICMVSQWDQSNTVFLVVCCSPLLADLSENVSSIRFANMASRIHIPTIVTRRRSSYYPTPSLANGGRHRHPSSASTLTEEKWQRERSELARLIRRLKSQVKDKSDRIRSLEAADEDEKLVLKSQIEEIRRQCDLSSRRKRGLDRQLSRLQGENAKIRKTNQLMIRRNEQLRCLFDRTFRTTGTTTGNRQQQLNSDEDEDEDEDIEKELLLEEQDGLSDGTEPPEFLSHFREFLQTVRLVEAEKMRKREDNLIQEIEKLRSKNLHWKLRNQALKSFLRKRFGEFENELLQLHQYSCIVPQLINRKRSISINLNGFGYFGSSSSSSSISETESVTTTSSTLSGPRSTSSSSSRPSTPSSSVSCAPPPPTSTAENKLLLLKKTSSNESERFRFNYVRKLITTTPHSSSNSSSSLPSSSSSMTKMKIVNLWEVVISEIVEREFVKTRRTLNNPFKMPLLLFYYHPDSSEIQRILQHGFGNHHQQNVDENGRFVALDDCDEEEVMVEDEDDEPIRFRKNPMSFENFSSPYLLLCEVLIGNWQIQIDEGDIYDDVSDLIDVDNEIQLMEAEEEEEEDVVEDVVGSVGRGADRIKKRPSPEKYDSLIRFRSHATEYLVFNRKQVLPRFLVKCRLVDA